MGERKIEEGREGGREGGGEGGREGGRREGGRREGGREGGRKKRKEKSKEPTRAPSPSPGLADSKARVAAQIVLLAAHHAVVVAPRADLAARMEALGSTSDERHAAVANRLRTSGAAALGGPAPLASGAALDRTPTLQGRCAIILGHGFRWRFRTLAGWVVDILWALGGRGGGEGVGGKTKLEIGNWM